MENKLSSSTALTSKLIFFILMVSTMGMLVSATNHTVGGPTGWDLNSNMAVWVKTVVFYPGDNLVFIYQSTAHNVLEVDQNGYQGCQANKSISNHTDGNTIIPLTRTGNRYFICGVHCQQGLKVQVTVMKNSTGGTSPNNNSNKPPPPKLPKRSPPPPSTRKSPPPPKKSKNQQPPTAQTAPTPDTADVPSYASPIKSQYSTLSIISLMILFLFWGA